MSAGKLNEVTMHHMGVHPPRYLFLAPSPEYLQVILHTLSR